MMIIILETLLQIVKKFNKSYTEAWYKNSLLITALI
jgi:hypothetical protein